MKKPLYWLLASLSSIACALFVGVQLGWLHPQHTQENAPDELLTASHLPPEPIKPPDFHSSNFKREDPIDLAHRWPDICELHSAKMRIEVVPIYYGTPSSMFRDKNGKRLLAPGEIDPDVRDDLFPHSAHEHWGGCVVGDDSPKTAKIWICSHCERAEKKWREENPQEVGRAPRDQPR